MVVGWSQKGRRFSWSACDSHSGPGGRELAAKNTLGGVGESLSQVTQTHLPIQVTVSPGENPIWGFSATPFTPHPTEDPPAQNMSSSYWR